LANDITAKKCSSNQLIKLSHSDTPTVHVFGVYSLQAVPYLLIISWTQESKLAHCSERFILQQWKQFLCPGSRPTLHLAWSAQIKG